MARPPRDPNSPKPPRRGAASPQKPKSPSAAARDARRAEQHAAVRPPRPAPVAPEPKVDRRRGRETTAFGQPSRGKPDTRTPRAAASASDRPVRGRVAGAEASTARPTRTTDAPFRDRAAPFRNDRTGDERPRATSRDRAPGSQAGRTGVPASRPVRADAPFRDRAAPFRNDRAEGERSRAAPRDRAPSPQAGRTVSPGARPTRADSLGRTASADRPIYSARPFAKAQPARPERTLDQPVRGERPAFATRADRNATRPPRPEASRRGAARHERIPAAPRPPRESGDGQRIAKLLARAGVASRREIERMIEEGRVAIAGVAISTPATILKSLHEVTVDGRAVQAAAPTRLFRYHKPSGLLTAERDPAGRLTIYDRLPAGLPRVMPVGRLDLNTEGLLLLTTDGEFKRALELPATGVQRTYRARVFGEVSQAQLEDLIDGIEIEGVRYGAIDANLERRTGRNGWVEMSLREGKNREVRRVLEHLGLQVSRLIRTAYGPFGLDDLPPGEVDEVRQHDLVQFRKTLA
ncbi:pseudouridine synthase [Sphingomonas solaris]|uniref:Pseudouridine synthase n=1 Tax=Alterirhizorhabdus solaris TaxID=2529389 RepID=A0A558R0A1_9SPHN|nr:pseudouridine synthase [Sphingomonas solaris]TVV72821.1 pseudouridine synthase [Sphingomonas solaris]